jgi:Zn ribbon nucleic-acid-binding protein
MGWREKFRCDCGAEEFRIERDDCGGLEAECVNCGEKFQVRPRSVSAQVHEGVHAAVAGEEEGAGPF